MQEKQTFTSRSMLPFTLALGAVVLVGCNQGKPATEEETIAAIAPQAQWTILLNKVEPGNRTGEEIYNTTCKTCHAAGTLNAPKFGDAGDWAPRIAKGYDGLVHSAINGFNAMPAKGGAADLTEDEVRRAVAYMANSAGAKFTAPPVAEDK